MKKSRFIRLANSEVWAEAVIVGSWFAVLWIIGNLFGA